MSRVYGFLSGKWLLLLLPLSLLVSCRPAPVYLQFHTSDANIRSRFTAAAADYTKISKGKTIIKIWDDSKGSPRADLPVVHIGFRAYAPSAGTVPGLVALPLDWISPDKWETSMVLKKWAGSDFGSLSVLPLFWNGWGISVFLADRSFFSAPKKGAPVSMDWKTLPMTLGKKAKLLMPGASVSGRQVFFALSALDSLGNQKYSDLVLGKEKYGNVKDVFSAYAKAGTLQFLFPNTEFFTQADVENIRKSGNGQAFLESFQDYFLDKGNETRVFTPVTVNGRDASFSLVGTVLSAYLSGKKSASLSKGFLEYISSIDFQKSFSMQTGLMPCNFQAPVLDEVNMNMRNVLINAQSFSGINPEPGNEPACKKLDETLGKIRKSPAQWELLLPD